MSIGKVIWKSWAVLCGVADLGLIAVVIAGAVQGGIRPTLFAYLSFATAISVFLLAPFLAFTFVAGHRATNPRKHGFLAVGAIHVVLAALFQIGPSAVFVLPALVLPGITYFILAFLTQKRLTQH